MESLRTCSRGVAKVRACFIGNDVRGHSHMTSNKRREVRFMLGEQVHTLQRMEIKNIFDDAAWHGEKGRGQA